MKRKHSASAPRFALPDIRQLVLPLLMVYCSNAPADNTWSYHQESDRLTNKTYSFALSPLPQRGLYDNIRLKIVCKDNILQVAVEADSLIASQDSAFDFEYQIDKKTSVTLPMKTYKDSKRKGYTEENAKRIVDDLLSGQSMFIRINTMIRKVLSAMMALENASPPVRQVVSDCGLSVSDKTAGDTAYTVDQFEKDLAKLPPDQQQQVLNKIKQIILETQKAH